MTKHRARWASSLGLALSLAAGAGAGCGGRASLEPPFGGSTGTAGTTGGGGAGGAAAPPARKIDLLFMIDDSAEMVAGQANIKAGVPAFMNLLAASPRGLPDVHIAVVTSDMGAGDGSSIGGCTKTGDGGVFRFAPSGGCTATNLPAGATFITSTGGADPVTNFGGGDIAAELQCIMAVGDSGCGFEHQLASVARALGADGSPPPPQNAGFLRPDAVLAIVLVSNEDDCSAPPGSPLYNPTSSTLASMYVVTYSPAGGPDNCVSAESQGLLLPVAAGGFTDQIDALKADPTNQVVVAAFAGPPTEYTVAWQTPPSGHDTGPWPFIRPSCLDMPSLTFADPAVRIHQFVGEFGTNGLFDTYCQADYGATLAALAARLNQLIGS
jgi:hypothetical protein